MVFSYEVKTLTLDLFPSELIALKMPGFNPLVLQLHSFPSVEENHTMFPQPIHQSQLTHSCKMHLHEGTVSQSLG